VGIGAAADGVAAAVLGRGPAAVVTSRQGGGARGQAGVREESAPVL